MLFPESRSPKKYCASFWQRFFLDLPSFQFARIVTRRETLEEYRRKAGCRFTTQYADSNISRFLPDTLALIEAATHNAQAQLMIKNAVDRSVCDPMEMLQRFVGIVCYTRSITQ